MSCRVGFIGLGVMGYPMAGHLARAGHQVTVFNRSPEKAECWSDEFGGEMVDAPVEVAEAADIVFACVGNDDDLRQVTVGARGALHAMKAGQVFVDHTTASAQVARDLSKVATTHDAAFLDAPVSGGQVGAEAGKLSIMVGGDVEAYERVRPLLECYAARTRLMGPSGTGQLSKMVNQICIAGLLQGLSEAMHFCRRAELDPLEVLQVISGGAAQSWQMENRALTMCEGRFDFGFAIDWMRKDLSIVLDEARRNGSLLPITALVDQFYAELQRDGCGRWDTSSLICRLDGMPPERG